MHRSTDLRFVSHNNPTGLNQDGPEGKASVTNILSVSWFVSIRRLQDDFQRSARVNGCHRQQACMDQTNR